MYQSQSEDDDKEEIINESENDTIAEFLSQPPQCVLEPWSKKLKLKPAKTKDGDSSSQWKSKARLKRRNVDGQLIEFDFKFSLKLSNVKES